MYSTCLFCQRPLLRNGHVDAFPVGRRLAFDAPRGRLWVICTACERWNLAPFEERWEAVEQCDRLFSIARRRVTSDNIGLAQIPPGLELIRIGTPLREEFAAWRYGDQFGRRRRRLVGTVATAAVAGSALVIGALGIGVVAGGAYLAARSGLAIRERRRRERVVTRLRTEDGETLTVRGTDVGAAELRLDRHSRQGWSLKVQHTSGSQIIAGYRAMSAVSTLMPHINGTGGTSARVSRAIQRLEGFVDPTDFIRSAAATSMHDSRPGDEASLSRLPGDIRLAVEMAAQEENERCALEGELWLLEEAWRDAEQIAAIADALLMPPSVERRFQEMKNPAERHPPQPPD